MGLLFVSVISALLYFNLSVWHSRFLGYTVFAIFLIFSALKLQTILHSWFGFSKTLRAKLLSAFLALNIFGFLAAAFLFFNERLSDFAIMAAFFLTGALACLVKKKAARSEKDAHSPEDDWQVLEENPQHKIIVAVYLVLAVIGFYLLHSARGSEQILTPWQIIDKNYLLVYFGATAVLGALLFSRAKAKVLLFILLVHAFLTFSYLPLTHEFFYGADQWRHIATESRLVAGLPFNTAQLSETPGSILRIFDVGKMAYAQFWSLGAILSKILQLDLLALNKWLAPALYALIFPLLLFEIGRALDFGKRKSLIFAYCGFLPFALQIAGAFTLPNNLSFLYFLFLFLLLIKWRKDSNVYQTIGLAVLGALFIFGYWLYFILFWLFWLFLFLHKKSWSVFWLAFIPACFLLPALELAAGYSRLANINLAASIKKLLTGLLSWRVVFGLPTFDTDFGNILFNQPAANALVKNIFTVWPHWFVVFAALFWALFLLGGYKIFKTPDKQWLAALAAALFANHFIARLFLGGENILTRRMDFLLAFFVVILVFYALMNVVPEYWPAGADKGAWIIAVFILLFSLISAVSYSTGPDASAISQAEYTAISKIWADNQGAAPLCVLAKTYPLLALEYLSQRQVIGGGFPINENFAQPERESVYQSLLQRDDESAKTAAKALTGAEVCYLVAQINELQYNISADKIFFRTSNLLVEKF